MQSVGKIESTSPNISILDCDGPWHASTTSQALFTADARSAKLQHLPTRQESRLSRSAKFEAFVFI